MMTGLRDMVTRYHEALNKAETREELIDVLVSMDDGYSHVPLEVLSQLTDDDFEAWRAGLANERMGVSNEDWWYERFLDLLVPPPFARLLLIERGEWRPEGDGE